MAATQPTAGLAPGRPAGIAWRALLRRRVPGVLAFLAFVGVWWLAVEVTNVREILLPPPDRVLAELVRVTQLGLLQEALASSMYALAVGLGLSLLVGVPIGLIVGYARTADLISYPYLWGFFATPRIALAPLMVLWFGLGAETKIWLVFLSAVIPIILSCRDGVKTADESLRRAAISFSASRRDLFVKVLAPNTLPFIASGIRNGISRGIVGLLVIEMLVGSGGLGTQTMRAMRSFNTARMFAFVAVLVVIALFLIGLSKRLEAYASRWREDVEI
jgi:ABC-type nitrate/sulfonate/bicarbonate transport system permease component